MRTQISSCPHCGMVVLDDSPECHGCGKALEQQTVAAPTTKPPTSERKSVLGTMETCPNCGESCRVGLVRCWNCSAFLRPEIEASYRKMRQSGRYEVERVELPIIDASHVTQEDSFKRRVSTPESFLASQSYSLASESEGDDFELSNDAQLGEDDDELFELNENLSMADAVPGSDNESDGGYALQASGIEPTIPLATNDSGAPSSQIAPSAQGEAAAESLPMKLSEPGKNETTSTASPDEDLLKIAADEEQDIQRVRKTLRSKDTFIVFCPQGCRIRVKERHRGMSGKCPRCQSTFIVPLKPLAKPTEGGSAEAPPVLESRYKKWMTDIRLHAVDPKKLRIKADSLFNECQPVDLGFSPEGLLIATLLAGKFGANPKKIPPLRQAMIDHFVNQGTVETLNAVAKKMYPTELLQQFTLIQPTPPGTESLFADIPVFGTNRIAVRIPKMADDPFTKYLSFNLSEFRAFTEALESICGVGHLGTNSVVPVTDDYATFKCHVKNVPVLDLKNRNYYEKDPGFKLEVSGWKCAACGIVIGEPARAETKLGGANGKAIAKAKCPKCTKKYGNVPLYQLAGATTPKSEPEPAAAEKEAVPAS